MDATGEWQCKQQGEPLMRAHQSVTTVDLAVGDRTALGREASQAVRPGAVLAPVWTSAVIRFSLHRRRARRAKGRPRGRRRRGRRAAARANQVPQSQRHAPLAEGGRGDRGEIRRARALEPAARRQQRQQGTRLIRQQGTRNSARPYAVVPRGRPRNHRRPPRALSLSSLSWQRFPPSAASHASW